MFSPIQEVFNEVKIVEISAKKLNWACKKRPLDAKPKTLYSTIDLTFYE